MPSGLSLPFGLRYENASDWVRSGKSPASERKRQFAQPSLDPVRLDDLEVLTVHARRTLVGAALGIGVRQKFFAADLVVEGRSGSRLQPSLLRATPSAVSERCPELIGCPISRSFTTSCVCLELRPLPSPGVTRLPRYYKPLRHPNAPGLSLAGVRFIPDHAMGLPVLRALSLCTCRRQYPGAATGRRLRSSRPAVSAFPEIAVDVGLHIVLFEACAAFTRVAARTLAPSPICDALYRRLQPFRHLHDCSGCFRLERLAGWAAHPLGKALPSHGARQRAGVAGRPRALRGRSHLTSFKQARSTQMPIPRRPC